MVYSASSDILLVNGFSPSVYMKRQIIYFVAAFLFFGIPCFALKLKIFKNRKFVMSYLSISFLMLFFLIVLKVISQGTSLYVVNKKDREKLTEILEFFTIRDYVKIISK